MSYSFGKNFKVTVFGESHQKAVGVVIEGLPSGYVYPQQMIEQQLKRRAPGQKGTTQRLEKDEPQVLCGLYQDTFTGSALTAIFENGDTRSQDYPKMFRPSHSDYPAYIKYKGFNDARGGGQFSARLTLPLVYAGAIAKDLLAQCHIHVAAHLTQVGALTFDKYNPCEKIASHQETEIPKEVFTYLDTLEGDSVGAKIECLVDGLPVGIGEPLFDSVESRLSHLLFSVPGVKGVMFGDAIQMPESLGSQMNDCYDENLKTTTNHNGGILGGLTTGMPLVFETYLKPTASIAKPQLSYDAVSQSIKEIQIKGRHDRCIGLRALPIIEACGALVIYDLLLETYGNFENLKEIMYE